MAMLTQADVERIVEVKFGELRDSAERTGVQVGQLMEGAQTKLNQVETQSNSMLAKMAEHEERINRIIASCNEEFEAVRERYAEQKSEADTQMGKTEEILKKDHRRTCRDRSNICEGRSIHGTDQEGRIGQRDIHHNIQDGSNPRDINHEAKHGIANQRSDSRNTRPCS